jgi:hypothetical protein
MPKAAASVTPAIIQRSAGVMPSTLPKRAASKLRVKRRCRLMAATPMAKLAVVTWCDACPMLLPSLWQLRRDGEDRLAMRHGRVEQYGAPAVAHGLRTVPVPSTAINRSNCSKRQGWVEISRCAKSPTVSLRTPEQHNTIFDS